MRAERLILSGKIYSADELYEMGVVDVLTDPGAGVEAVHDLIVQRRKRSLAYAAMQKVRQQYQPLDYRELLRITEIWVDTALQLSAKDLKTMARLVRAQSRRQQTAGPTPPQAAPAAQGVAEARRAR